MSILQSKNSILVVWCAVSLLAIRDRPVVAGSRERLAPDADDLSRLREIVTAYRSNIQSIQSIDLRYRVMLNDTLRHAAYSRDRDRHYQASVAELPAGQGWSLADEVAWDGTFSYHRAAPNFLVRGGSKILAHQSLPTPQDAAGNYADFALGLESANALDPATFTGSEVLPLEDGCERTKLVFAGSKSGYRIETVFAVEFAWAPVRTVFYNRAGARLAQVDVKHVKLNVNGAAFCVPAKVTTESFLPNGARANLEVLTVDVGSVRVNCGFPEGHFRIAPWPCEEMKAFGSGKVITPAKDRKWNPIGRVAFPWAEFVKVRQK